MPVCYLFQLLALTGLLYTSSDNYQASITSEREDSISNRIQLNQVGIHPGATLRFSVVAFDGLADAAPGGRPGLPVKGPSEWFVVTEDKELVVAKGQLGELRDWTALTGVKVWMVETPAPPSGLSYRIYVPGIGYSHDFAVKARVYRDVLIGTMRSNYLQRMGTDLPEEHAGVYARKGGHFDRDVQFHPSSGRAGRTTSPGGWYDAGDYGKYVVNASFPLAQYLTLQEDVKWIFKDGDLNIPESGNGMDDYLDELRYELDWLLTMQDRDGGMFHKLTTLDFDKMIMPADATAQRYIIGKSTEATLNFAGAAAQASRVYKTVDAEFSNQLLSAAESAWAWAELHPAMGFTNPDGVSTGQYGDNDWRDERAFAAAELFVTTGAETYLTAYQNTPPRTTFEAGEGWRIFMGKLGMMTLLRFPDRVPTGLYDKTETDVIRIADSLVAVAKVSPYGQPITEFHWGSNSDVLNAAMLVAAADRLVGKDAYRKMIYACVDYVMGHKATGYSFITGFGDRSPMFIHHRPSMADGVAQPFPGFLAGGPNPGRQDSAWATYPENAAPMQSWVDQEGSYASNEICLNWNAPLTYLLGYLEATQ